MEKKLTISDIAKEVGVSKTTISRYLNGNYAYMSAETRGKIEYVINVHNYVPNSVARTLKSKKSRLIGVVVNTLRYQVGAQTVTGINDVCSRNDYGTIVCCTNDDPEKEAEAIQLCLNQQVEGMVIIPCTNDRARYEAICSRGVPIVLCTRRIEGWPYGCVYVKHDELICQMLDHLKEQGFKKVRFLLDVDNFHKAKMANVFARKAELLFGMDRSESVTLIGRTSSRVSQAVDQFLKEYPGQQKAVLAVNTHTLFLLLKHLEKLDVRIPQDLGVCGYDAIGWSELMRPGVTSMRQPMDQMGIQAGEKLLKCLAEGEMSRGWLPLTGTVSFRESTLLHGNK